MGIDPNDDTYDAGDECIVCVDELFNGVTPKYVDAVVQDLEKCLPFPVWAEDPPEGVFALEQDTPCSWIYISPTFMTFQWILLAAQSHFVITKNGFTYFQSIIADKCYDAFPNKTVCGIGPVLSENGYVTLWWGPDIPPPC